MGRNEKNIYPDYSAELAEIKAELGELGLGAISSPLLGKIIRKHKLNAKYNREMYNRYMGLDGSAPIDGREPRFHETDPINNKVKTDFVGEIVDFKTGYFAGKPIAYGYSKTDEAKSVTGGMEAIDRATKAVTDFVTRNNMFGVDMEITKMAAIAGYAGRLFYVDPEGEARVMPVPAWETVILSSSRLSEPEYAVRYYYTELAGGAKTWHAEFYDSEMYHVYEGGLGDLKLIESRIHLFGGCPLQAVENNNERIGDAEKVLSEIDAYEKVLSDNINDVESFAHAYMVFQGLSPDDETLDEARRSGAFSIPGTGATSERKIYFLTKEVNDSFAEHQLDRLEGNIYRFSKTPDLSDETFGTASGVSLKFKLHGLETKCGMFQAKMMDAATHMWRLLAGFWALKQIAVDPLQITMDFKRNFPMDTLSNAQAAQALMAAGLPKSLAWGIAVPEIDDVDYALEMAEAETEGIPALTGETGEEEGEISLE